MTPRTYTWTGDRAVSDRGAVLGVVSESATLPGRWWGGVRGPKWAEATRADAVAAVDRVLARRGWGRA